MPEESLRAWVGLIRSFAPQPSPAVLEIGAGVRHEVAHCK
jgi:hypothetical protein